MELLKWLQTAVTTMSYGNIIVTVKCKIQLVEVIILFTEATVVKTTEATASVASNVATAMNWDSCPTPAKNEGIEYLQSWPQRN